jgi:CDP-paratose 2-epimerase
MSYIFGPRQFGNEDHVRVAHFITAARTGRALTIYGDCKQARDMLFVDGLARAFRAASENNHTTPDQIFNIGGGPSNTLSVWRKFGAHLQKLKARQIPARFGSWRPGDRPCYVRDIRKAKSVLRWRPQVDKVNGVERLWKRVEANPSLFTKQDAPAPVAKLEKASAAAAGGVS